MRGRIMETDSEVQRKKGGGGGGRKKGGGRRKEGRGRKEEGRKGRKEGKEEEGRHLRSLRSPVPVTDILRSGVCGFRLDEVRWEQGEVNAGTPNGT